MEAAAPPQASVAVQPTLAIASSTLPREDVEPIKMIVMAPAGYRKTSALASLLSAGYNVRVIDTDNGIRTLREVAKDTRYAKDSLARLNWATITEPMKIISGRISPAKATVWPRAVGLLDHWKWEDPAQGGLVDLGKVSTWTSRDVLVLDTFTKLAYAARNFHLALNGKLGVLETGNEYQRNIGAAQGLCDSLIQLLFDEGLKCNVILNAHVNYSKEDGTMPQQGEVGAQLMGYPKGIGNKMGPSIPTYFQHVLAMRKQGTTSRLVTSDASMGLKSSSPASIKPSYASETGLAEYFADIRGEAAPKFGGA